MRKVKNVNTYRGYKLSIFSSGNAHSYCIFANTHYAKGTPPRKNRPLVAVERRLPFLSFPFKAFLSFPSLSFQGFPILSFPFLRGWGGGPDRPTPISRILKYSDQIMLLVVEGELFSGKSEFPNFGNMRLSRPITQLRDALNPSYTVLSELTVGARSKKKSTQPPIIPPTWNN